MSDIPRIDYDKVVEEMKQYEIKRPEPLKFTVEAEVTIQPSFMYGFLEEMTPKVTVYIPAIDYMAGLSLIDETILERRIKLHVEQAERRNAEAQETAQRKED